jgi:anionic cell wall polymer biosynthesis LytR-Cps2A-Psr (LCP) family protein
MQSKIKNGIRLGMLGVLGAAIVVSVGMFYRTDHATGGTEVEDTQAFEAKTEPTEYLVRLGDTMYRYTDDIDTILFLGTDESGNEATEDEEAHGAMADMVMVAVINHTKQEYAVLQLNRDTITTVDMIDSDGNGGASAELQLCTAHWFGGSGELNCTNTARAVSQLLGGIQIDTYYCLTWEGITSLNAVVDGVTLTIQNDFSQIDPSLVMGETITLTDEQAYEFLRGRHGIDDGENLSRMERHRQYLSAWMQKVKEKTAEDSTFPAKAYQDLNPYASTNLKGSQINKGSEQIMSYNYLGIFNIDGTTTLGSRLGDGIDHMEFYMDADAKLATLTQLYSLEETDYDAEGYELWDDEEWDEVDPYGYDEDDEDDEYLEDVGYSYEDDEDE